MIQTTAYGVWSYHNTIIRLAALRGLNIAQFVTLNTNGIFRSIYIHIYIYINCQVEVSIFFILKLEILINNMVFLTFLELK